MYREAADFIRKQLPQDMAPKIGLVLGSGLGTLADSMEDPILVDYGSVPGFPHSTVEGHKGRFVIGDYQGKPILIMQGRFHYYEGKEMEEVILPIRMMRDLGIGTLVLTNAAGGINTDFRPGDIMLITDHINLSGTNPLRGENYKEFGPRFPDMSNAYDSGLRQITLDASERLGISIRTGIYAMMQGPSYETPAEIRMLRMLGADAVGMSTVPEVLAAVHAQMKVLGISCITNMAAGILKKSLTHQEVLETANQSKDKFIQLINAVIAAL
ncbi:purine-nucleoside phosphorylase [Eubacteriales bacterium mix99]|jgi:purine-nucleoside phosphorylase